MALRNGTFGRIASRAWFDVDAYAGGWFTVGDGIVMTNAAVLDTGSSSWTNLASGIDTAAGDGSVYALALADGQLHAGGLFDQAGGVSASHVAAWDGET